MWYSFWGKWLLRIIGRKQLFSFKLPNFFHTNFYAVLEICRLIVSSNSQNAKSRQYYYAERLEDHRIFLFVACNTNAFSYLFICLFPVWHPRTEVVIFTHSRLRYGKDLSDMDSLVTTDRV